ncbi:hypothetical protein XELAEV_18001568mg [Xenopus laevis]|nr:hypothetical protein XELAEV_18001568mg [Xenopus laevis]
MSHYESSKLTLKNVLEVGHENIQRIECQTVKDFPWYFLWKLMALSPAARCLRVPYEGIKSEERNLDEDVEASNNTPYSVHPLDVLCVLLHCSDPCLQQEMLSKMCLCQFAVPLLLPAGDGPGCTYMLWAMRGIVKRWRPQSSKDMKEFCEDNLVHIKMPMFSFTRLGKCNLSKSHILNQLLSLPHQVQEFFLHREMESGYTLRKISDGLVEISWYFPGSSDKMNIFKEPIAVANMRGDLQSALEQFKFLTRVSSSVFIFTESISEREYEFLSKIEDRYTRIIIIVLSSEPVSKETEEHIKLLQNKKRINIFKKKNSVTDRKFVKLLIHVIEHLMQNDSDLMNLEEMSKEAKEFGINVDEASEEIKDAKVLAQEITGNIKSVAQYKKNTMRLHGNLWKKISGIEKEMCRMRKQGKKNAETYRAKLMKTYSELREKQNAHAFPDDMQTFTDGITRHKLLFLKTMMFYIDAITRDNLHSLHKEYRESFYHFPGDTDRLKEIDLRIRKSSLGAEHFLRELGQFYEAKYLTAKDRKITGKYTKFPAIVAELFLDGFPLELIDGDVSNIPIHWITDILSELDSKTGGRCRLRVITVLGVQSTGKSTLLNTMFGLQLPVSGGRCTRGAFMTLLQVKDKLQIELGCEFILVVDTEGLRSPEMASLAGSYEHDNELATLVVGLSDITIINMAMENTTEMKDILQLVIHAFVRMKQIGKKPNCQFVHQNVSDVSAYERNLRDRHKLLQHLNEMTLIAARMEKKSQIAMFSDVIDYNLEEHTWYIPGMWYGVPPMASVNSGYSDGVYDLKLSLISYLQSASIKAQTIPEFTEWIKSLWNAVKHEKFIFSLRNSLVSEAYNQLCMHYTGWEWNFQKSMHSWFKEMTFFIKNLPADKVNRKTCKKIKECLNRRLREEETIMLESLKEFLHSGCDNVHLLEPFKTDFSRSVKYLRKTQEMSLATKFEEVFHEQKEKFKFQKVLDHFNQIMADRVTTIIEIGRNTTCKTDDHQLKREFEEMWEKTLEDVTMSNFLARNINQEILHHIKLLYGSSNPELLTLNSLEEFSNSKLYSQKYFSPEYFFPSCIINKCRGYIAEIVNTKEYYDEIYSQELLQMIREGMKKNHTGVLQDEPSLQLDLVFFIVKEAALEFQRMHNEFLKKNNPGPSLRNLKDHYYYIFESIYREKDECLKRAKYFCKLCLEPAISQHIFEHTGGMIMSDILHRKDALEFKSRTVFQFKVLQNLLEHMSFQWYLNYLDNYESFAKTWIVMYIKHQYKDMKCSRNLQIEILKSIMKTVRWALETVSKEEKENVLDFVDHFCSLLNKDLAIEKKYLQLVIFQSKVNSSEFSEHIQFFLNVMEEKISMEIQELDIDTILSQITLKPQDELLKKVIGCGKQCPFCKVPCEAATADHKEHFASLHRPKGLAKCNRISNIEALDYSICSTDITSNDSFISEETDFKPHPYKDYRTCYPDWIIYPEISTTCTDYWKFVFKEFNEQFADAYCTKPADIPKDWQNITQEKALHSLKESFRVKEWLEYY